MYNVREFKAYFFMYEPFLNVVALAQQSLYGAFTLDTLHVLAVSQTPFQKNFSGFIIVCGFEKYVIRKSLADCELNTLRFIYLVSKFKKSPNFIGRLVKRTKQLLSN